jgi:hypothetical protein
MGQSLKMLREETPVAQKDEGGVGSEMAASRSLMEKRQARNAKKEGGS